MSEFTDLARLVTFRPLERPLTCLNRRSPFSANWGVTVRELARELRLHGARLTVLEVDLRERDFRVDGMPRADRSARSPGVRLSFKATGVPGQPNLLYEAVEFSHWQDNVRALALGLDALRKVDRYGISKRGQQYTGWKALEAGGPDVARGRELIEELGGPANALRATHPDTRNGGYTDADYQAVLAAR
jgi:hypothetical protein